jgi:poly-gamma-glutamate capsule biosynthesis protein CapA/YwtB (metallophosphatase superfamily)
VKTWFQSFAFKFNLYGYTTVEYTERYVAAVAAALDSVANVRSDSPAPPTTDVRVVSIHWGGNWGWDPEPGQRAFAHALVDRAGVHVVWGHSSHHVKAVEVYKRALILYGCGDLVNDCKGGVLQGYVY